MQLHTTNSASPKGGSNLKARNALKVASRYATEAKSKTTTEPAAVRGLQGINFEARGARLCAVGQPVVQMAAMVGNL